MNDMRPVSTLLLDIGAALPTDGWDLGILSIRQADCRSTAAALASFGLAID
jgi:hypothetical protein